MAGLDIPCPECGRLLKLPDRSLIGKKARCGKCGHRFMLRDPGESGVAPVPAQSTSRDLTFRSADEAESDDDETLVGIAARYVPEEPAPERAPGALFTTSWPPATSTVDVGLPADVFPTAVEELESESDFDATVRARQRKQKKQRQRQMVVGGCIAGVMAISVGLYVGLSGNQSAAPGKKKARTAVAKVEPTDDDSDSQVPGDQRQEKSSKLAEPIALTLVPEGARIVLHLRPADLWQPDGPGEEFRACLGKPLSDWLDRSIKDLCLLEPRKIEEALFALIPVSRDSFDVAVVVRTRQDMKRSDLIDKFTGELIDKPRAHYVGPDRAWMIFDARTFASAPASMAQSFVESAGRPAITSEGIEALLAKTDRKKHFTVVCELEDVRLGTKTLVPENAQKLLEGVVDFFGDDVETVAWSLNLGDPGSATKLVSDVLVRNKNSRSPPKLQDDLKKKLAALPAQMLSLVYMTDPKKIGEKKIVGRLPIMTKVVEKSTQFSTSRRLVSMQVALPERAGPNLALGTLLTWNQTTRPEFGKSSSAPGDSGDSILPEKIADRLKKKISVEFRREFMYNATDWIGRETGVEIVLDGPGMKDVGVTKNMYQTFTMDDVPATAVLHQILVVVCKNQLVLIVDETNKKATITSTTAAERQKLTPFPLKPAPK